MKIEFQYIDGNMMKNKSKEEPCAATNLWHATEFKCQVGPIDSYAKGNGNGK
jgi:hypothetical protein